MKIALYGGAFNPVHNEHVNIALAAVKSLGFDKLIVIPTAISPHKKDLYDGFAKTAAGACRLAFGECKTQRVSDYEIKRGGISYSYLTCRHFKKLYPHDELYFVMGADMLESFHLWKEPQEILKCVTLAVCARENEEALKLLLKAFQARFRTDIVSFGYVGGAVSSTKIRTLAALGEDTAGLVPEKVRLYIRNKEIYALKELWGVKKLLTQERWEHTVRVAQCAAGNCRRAGVYEIDAITAAALHDCAKYLSENAGQLKGFTPPAGEPKPVIHQFSGAFVAEHTFGIRDADILNAIRYHTTGRENMSNLEKLIFLADLLEDGRSFVGVENLRKKFKRDIDECLLSALEHQLNYLKSTGAPVSSLTRRAYEYLKENK